MRLPEPHTPVLPALGSAAPSAAHGPDLPPRGRAQLPSTQGSTNPGPRPCAQPLGPQTQLGHAPRTVRPPCSPAGSPRLPAGCGLVAERLRVCRTASLEPPEVTRWPAFRTPGELLTRRSGKRRAQDAWGEQGTGRCFLPQSSSCHRLDTHRPDQGKPERRRGPRRKARKRRAGSSLSGDRPASRSLTHSRHFLGYF